jgi:nuclear transport factor 2 (NTF2) superfamily protein
MAPVAMTSHMAMAHPCSINQRPIEESHKMHHIREGKSPDDKKLRIFY